MKPSVGRVDDPKREGKAEAGAARPHAKLLARIAEAVDRLHAGVCPPRTDGKPCRPGCDVYDAIQAAVHTGVRIAAEETDPWTPADAARARELLVRHRRPRHQLCEADHQLLAAAADLLERALAEIERLRALFNAQATAATGKQARIAELEAENERRQGREQDALDAAERLRAELEAARAFNKPLIDAWKQEEG